MPQKTCPQELERPTSQPRPAPPGPVVRAIVIMLAMLTGLAGAEVAAGWARGFAFPFLNVFVPDTTTYGVRLAPGRTTATRSRHGRVTTVRINREGFRGADWSEAPAPHTKRVLLLGDSQMFGYGVDETDAVAARLAGPLGDADAALGIGGGRGWEVLCAAVPTWGPPEYVRAARELVPRFQPDVVVFVANLANDWFEARVPNLRRTTARDGWAVHRLEGLEEPTSFPLREHLMGRSQLVFGVRELLALSQGLPPYAATHAGRLVDDLPHLQQPDGDFRSRLTRHVIEVGELCEAAGCVVLAATLPMDVQAHAAEWTKYDDQAIDLGPTLALADAFLREAREHGVVGVDLLPSLRAASPGAFLPDDYHLSPDGHATVARTLAGAITWTLHHGHEAGERTAEATR